jgi:uncharacterized protein
MSANNTICWADIPVTDIDRSIRFYSAVLGKKVSKVAEHGMEFGLLPHSENNVAGCLCKEEGNRPSEHGPLVYLSVDGRLDDAIKAVSASGGKVVKPKHAIGPYGFKSVIIDTEGNRIALHSQTA